MSQSVLPTEEALEQNLVRLGQLVTGALDEVIGQALGSTRTLRPSRLNSATHVGKDVAYRLLKALRCEDPITALHLLPGPAPLRRILSAASRYSVNPESIAKAAQAVDEFERLIRYEAGDRGTLDLMISGWLPEARRKDELLAKQAVFRGIRHIKGLSADVQYEVALLRPSDDDRHMDAVIVRGLKGLCRWRRGVELRFASRRIHPPAEASTSLSLSRRPIERVDDWLVRDFSSPGAMEIDVLRTPNAEFYSLRADTLGIRSAASVVFAELVRRGLSRYCSPGNPRKSGFSVEVSLPVRLLIADVILHADAYPGSRPHLHIYDTSFNGLADVNDPLRDPDRLPISETVEFMGQGLDGLRIREVPRYVELLRYVFSQLGWDPRPFRAYRCRIDYPLYGSQVTIAFDRPLPP